MPPLRTFTFTNNSLVIQIEAYSYEQAVNLLIKTVINPLDFLKVN